jgi:hypothetical protein
MEMCGSSWDSVLVVIFRDVTCMRSAAMVFEGLLIHIDGIWERSLDPKAADVIDGFRFTV